MGEYPIGDYLICTPVASIMQNINYSDIAKYNGVEMRKGMNGNSFVASVSAPLLLPNEFTLSLRTLICLQGIEMKNWLT